MGTQRHDEMTRRIMVLEMVRKLGGYPVVTAASLKTGRDALLIRDCSEFNALERLGQLICSSGDSIEEDLAAERVLHSITARQAPILHRIVATRACTGRGLRAKAASLALWQQDMFETETTCWNLLLVRSLVTDLLQMAPG